MPEITAAAARAAAAVEVEAVREVNAARAKRTGPIEAAAVVPVAFARCGKKDGVAILFAGNFVTID